MQQQIPEPNMLDLEATAELPVLDVASSEATSEHEHTGRTDSWLAPEPAAPEAGPSGSAAELRDLEERLASKGARVIELEREIEHLRAAARFSPDVTSAPDALAALQRELAAANARSVVHLETLQTLETRRGMWELTFRGLDLQLDARDARLADAELELARRQTLANDLAADLDGRMQRIASLEAEVNALATALATRDEELRAAEAQLASSRSECERLGRESDARAAVQIESVALLQRDLQTAGTRALELEGDLRAAEDTIHRLETELRSKSLRLEELAKATEEWRHTAEATRRSLADTQTRLQRLEVEAANGAAAASGVAAATGEAAQRIGPGAGEPAPEGATRLLVRTTGDSEVVHVLGRKTTVGRTPDNDLQIDARFISRHHAVILAGPVQTVIEDLNSTNGVRVNSRRVTRQPLKDGDIVIIGKTRFRFAVRQSGGRS